MSMVNPYGLMCKRDTDKNSDLGYGLYPFSDFDYFFYPELYSAYNPKYKSPFIDEGDNYLCEIDMPGLDKEDIDIQVDGSRLTVTAEKKEEKKDAARSARSSRKYSTTMTVPNADLNSLSAKYVNGVLELRMPKGAVKKIPVD